MNYVAGFLFHKGFVALVRKNKPENQQGKLNGIGGKIEPGETPVQAQVREFKEETGFETFPDNWDKFCKMDGEGWCVHFFRSVIPDEEERPELHNPDETEPVDWHLVGLLFDQADMGLWLLMPNLRWLIPMAQDNFVMDSSVYSL